MKLRQTISAKGLLHLQPSNKSLKKIFSFFVDILEKYFGSKLYLKISEKFHTSNAKILPAIAICSKIEELGSFKTEKIAKIPDEPFLHFFKTSTNNMAMGWGGDFFSEEKAFWKSLGESIERHIWINTDNFYQKKIIFASHNQLRKKALNIFSLAGFSDKQKKDIGILRFDGDSTFSWIRARSLISNKKTYCPVQLVSYYYTKQKVKTPRETKKAEPLLRWTITTGAAVGRNLNEALVKGILEIIERDAFMITYLNKLVPPVYDLKHLSNTDYDIKRMLARLDRYFLDVYLIKLPTDFPVNVTLALIIDKRPSVGRPALSIGASSDFDLKTSILNALSECLASRVATIEVLKNNEYKLPETNKFNKLDRMRYWAKTENIPKIDFILQGKEIKANLKRDINFYDVIRNENINRYYRKKLNFLTKHFSKKNYELIFTDLTHKEIKQFGLRCVQVVSPELQPMHLSEEIPYFGGRRLRDIPIKLGYKASSKLNKTPHPFP